MNQFNYAPQIASVYSYMHTRLAAGYAGTMLGSRVENLPSQRFKALQPGLAADGGERNVLSRRYGARLMRL